MRFISFDSGQIGELAGARQVVSLRRCFDEAPLEDVEIPRIIKNMRHPSQLIVEALIQDHGQSA